uniref:PDZ domain-containing protein n=1 Tax=Caenorhabditis tropicalis TaxID=1561998 RepID=A0A1I7TUW6_9PELO
MAASPNAIFHVKGKEEVQFDRKNVVVACDVVNGKITYVDVSSQLMGILFAGDEILNVNGEGVGFVQHSCRNFEFQNIKTTADFIKAISAKLPGKVTIEFMRDDHCLVSEKILPPRRPNTQMTELTLTYRGGAATGIIIHRMACDPKTVTIAMVQSASNACHYVKDGDVLVKVNDIYVLDRDSARKLLYASVNNTKTVRLTLERSTTTDPLGPAPPPPEGVQTTPIPSGAKKTGSSLMLPLPKPAQGKANKQFDVLLPPDVLEIMKTNKDFYKKMCKNPPCIIKTSNPTPSVAATLPSDAPPEVRIPYIQSPKPLKMTPKRVGS